MPDHPLLGGQEVRAVIEAFRYEVAPSGSGLYISWPHFPLSVRVDPVSESAYFAAVHCRTTSWEFAGDRSDLHDVLSHLAAVHLRRSAQRSCRIVDVPHPATTAFGGSPPIYARYIVPEQPTALLAADASGSKELRGLLYALAHLGHVAFHTLLEPGQVSEQSWSVSAAQAFAATVAEGLGQNVDDHDLVYSARVAPDLKYLRSGRWNMAVVGSSQIAELFAVLAARSGGYGSLRGIGGNFIVDGELQNFESNRVRRRIGQALAALGDTCQEIVPIENALVAIGSENLVFAGAESGRFAFERSRDKLRSRHEAERAMLFPPRSLTWADVIDPDRFEALTRDLLERDDAVLWVRRAGPTREGDAGRDLLVDRIVTAPPLGDDQPPAREQRQLVQCKVRSRTVGKADVQDVIDTLFMHQASSYLLVVSTKLSGTLVRALEAVRVAPGYHADWWTRDELEARLVRHPDILDRYSDIVRESPARRL